MILDKVRISISHFYVWPSRLSIRSVRFKIYDSSQYKVKMKNNDHHLVSVQGQFKIQSLWPSRLSTRSKWRTTTLSSQYKFSSKIKVYDPLVSVQDQIEEQRPSRLSTRSVQFKIYDPLVLVQGQNENNDPLVSVQGQFKNQRLWTSRLSTRSVQL